MEQCYFSGGWNLFWVEWNNVFFWWLEFILNGMEHCLFLLVVGIYFEWNGTMPFVIFVFFQLSFIYQWINVYCFENLLENFILFCLCANQKNLLFLHIASYHYYHFSEIYLYWGYFNMSCLKLFFLFFHTKVLTKFNQKIAKLVEFTFETKSKVFVISLLKNENFCPQKSISHVIEFECHEFFN